MTKHEAAEVIKTWLGQGAQVVAALEIILEGSPESELPIDQPADVPVDKEPGEVVDNSNEEIQSAERWPGYEVGAKGDEGKTVSL